MNGKAAAADVEDFGGDIQLALPGQSLASESFVAFDEIEVVDGHAVALHHFFHDDLHTAIIAVTDHTRHFVAVFIV